MHKALTVLDYLIRVNPPSLRVQNQLISDVLPLWSKAQHLWSPASTFSVSCPAAALTYVRLNSLLHVWSLPC